ncbi:MAG: glycosyltransferase [Rhodospirillales bacterium]|jgi:predicted glycosyltransferase|nr:glycosyltransferase [Rhodospirillales bacterium]MDP6884357.1 glycosyltransferase [Rhodospirillales bacterium]
MSGATVLFYVQHLLGIGHVKRAVTLARAMRDEGLEVVVVSGGEDVPVIDAGGINFVQLPPVRAADKSFKVLLAESGKPIDEAWKTRRRDLLLDLFQQTKPRGLVIELFPFGRRQLRFELIPLLDAAREARPRPAIVSSVRDILVEKAKPQRNDEMMALATTYFDAVLVHGDPALIPFDATFPLAVDLGERLRYTGYVADQAAVAEASALPPSGEVVVSAGGGAVSEELLRCAIEARPLTALGDKPWRLLVGHNLPDARFAGLRADAPKGVIVERARADFLSLLAASRLSISQGGYNTVTEVLATGTRGVIVPYAGGEETEQTIRARLLAERGLVQVVEERHLNPSRLAQAVGVAEATSPPADPGVRLDGAEASARIVASLAQGMA